jgi:aminotransferase
MIEVYSSRRRTMTTAFDQMGVTYGTTRGGFYLFANIQRAELSSYEFCARAVKDYGVLFFPGTMFGQVGEGYIRISYLAPPEQLEEALRRFSELWRSRTGQ